MKKVILIQVLLIALILGCGKQSGGHRLKKGTLAYETAKELVMKVPNLDPEKNQIVATCIYFNISTGDVIQHLFDNMGKDAAGIAQLPKPRIQQEINRAISQLADRQLLYQAALESGVTVGDAELDSLLQNQYNRFQGQEKFETWAQEKGISLDFVRKDFSSIMLIEKMLDQKFAGQIAVSDADIEDAYKNKTATVRHILLSTTGQSDSAKMEVRKRAEELLDRAKNGEDFIRLVETYSDDPGSKDKGGLYSDFERGTMVPPFEEAAFNTPVGEISDLVETRYGYHILKVENRKSETKPFEEVREQLRAALEAQKKAAAYSRFLQELKEKTEFKIIPLE